MASVRGDRGDTDVQEVVGVAQVFTQPLQGRLQQRLNALDHHLEVFLLTCRKKESLVKEGVSTLFMMMGFYSKLQTVLG